MILTLLVVAFTYTLTKLYRALPFDPMRVAFATMKSAVPTISVFPQLLQLASPTGVTLHGAIGNTGEDASLTEQRPWAPSSLTASSGPSPMVLPAHLHPVAIINFAVLACLLLLLPIVVYCITRAGADCEEEEKVTTPALPPSQPLAKPSLLIPPHTPPRTRPLKNATPATPELSYSPSSSASSSPASSHPPTPCTPSALCPSDSFSDFDFALAFGSSPSTRRAEYFTRADQEYLRDALGLWEPLDGDDDSHFWPHLDVWVGAGGAYRPAPAFLQEYKFPPGRHAAGLRPSLSSPTVPAPPEDACPASPDMGFRDGRLSLVHCAPPESPLAARGSPRRARKYSEPAAGALGVMWEEEPSQTDVFGPIVRGVDGNVAP